MPSATKTLPLLAVCIALAVLTLGAFWRVQRNDFVNYDDPDYVTQNPHVTSGLTADNIGWAFRASHSSNWHPLTWISHMLDCQLFGLENPGRHHLTSLVLHALNAVLLFLLLHRMTGTIWRSAFVAAVFALHPLRVESVAWIAERKDVLSTLFWLLAMLTYVQYVREIGSRRHESEIRNQKKKGMMTTSCIPSPVSCFPASKLYLVALAFFALGLMSKPMVVTLPFVLLLVDFWPLQRLHCRADLMRLFREKIPFFALMVLGCAVTMWAQSKGQSIKNLTDFPLGLRFENALISYARYIGKMFWPDGLAVFYPHPDTWPATHVAIAALLVAGLTALALNCRNRWPFLSIGWFWFVGTMIPVIGLVQVGIQSMADRYTYVPMIGLYVIVAWGTGELLARVSARKGTAVIAAAGVLTGCFVLTTRQVKLWCNSEVLFTHALNVTGNDNYTAHENLGIVLAGQNKVEPALDHFREGLRIYPGIAESHHNLGNALMAIGHVDEARECYMRAIELKPDYDSAYNNLASIALREGNMELARSYYAKVVEIKPDQPTGHYNLATALLELGQLEAASQHYAIALELQPDHVRSLYQMGIIAERRGRLEEAVRYFTAVVQFDPNDANARGELEKLRSGSIRTSKQ